MCSIFIIFNSKEKFKKKYFSKTANMNAALLIFLGILGEGICSKFSSIHFLPYKKKELKNMTLLGQFHSSQVKPIVCRLIV